MTLPRQDFVKTRIRNLRVRIRATELFLEEHGNVPMPHDPRRKRPADRLRLDRLTLARWLRQFPDV